MRLIGSKPYKITSVARDALSGVEILDNTGFDSDTAWSKEAGWTITGGKAVATSAGNTYTIHQDTNSSGASMNATLQIGKTYILKFTISDYSEGGVQPRMGNVYAYTLFNSNGDKSIEIQPTNITNNAIGLVCIGGSTTLKIDNISCKEKQPVSFQSSTSWTSTQTRDIEVLVVAGGGSGGHNPAPGQHGGGGGGGGIVHNKTYPIVDGWTYDVTVGGGGAGDQGDTPGSNSIFSRNAGGVTIENAMTALGGAEGGASGSYTGHPGTATQGGSGGGGGGTGPSTYPQGGGTQSGGRVSQLPVGYGSIGQGYGSSGGESNGIDSPEPGGGGGGGAGGYGYPGHREPFHNKMCGQTNGWRAHPSGAPQAANWSPGSQQGGAGGNGKQFPSFKTTTYASHPNATPMVAFGPDVYNHLNQPNYPGAAYRGRAPYSQGGYFGGGGGAGGVTNTSPASTDQKSSPRHGGGAQGGYNGGAGNAMFNTGGGGGGSHHGSDSGAGGSGFVGLVGEATTFKAPGVWDIKTIYKLKRRIHPLDTEILLDEWG